MSFVKAEGSFREYQSSVKRLYTSTSLCAGFIGNSSFKPQLPHRTMAYSPMGCNLTLTASFPHLGQRKTLGNRFLGMRTTFLRRLPILKPHSGVLVSLSQRFCRGVSLKYLGASTPEKLVYINGPGNSQGSVSTLRLAKETMELDLAFTETRIKHFIRDYVEKADANGVILGLSGGIDSSTVAALSALAIGGDRVLGLSMPEKETYSATDIRHVKMVADKFRFQLETIDITSMLQTCYTSIPAYDAKDLISKGNVKARVRMVCMYYYANRLGRIVVGSSDKSETMMGYFTKWGDVAADISPLMDLYKTQVRQLAHHIGIPSEIVTKPSTPRLWPGQLAEEELGIEYDKLDLILLGLENFLNAQEIAKQLGLPLKLVNNIRARWLSCEHKRRMPLTLKMEYRTVGKDFRLPYTIG